MSQSLTTPHSLIVAPSMLEYGAIQKALKKSQQSRQVKLMSCGVGEGQAQSFCQKLDRSQISRLVLLGWAGGLVPDLAVGDLVCADSARREGQPALDCQTVTLKNFHIGPILTVAKALLTSDEKRSAQSSGAIAVEMEAYPLASWASQRGIPFTHCRIILDTLDESLPDLGQRLDVSGRVRLIPFLRKISLQPRMILELWHLNNRIRSLDPALENLAVQVIQSLNAGL